MADHIDLTKPIKTVFKTNNRLNLIEFLTFPGSDHQEYLFSE